MRRSSAGRFVALLCVQFSTTLAVEGSEAHRVGIFEDQADVGSVMPPGTAVYDSGAARYTLTSAGANTWYHVDAFHYLWMRTSGDWTLTAEVKFPPKAYAQEPNPHRKGILMFRQSLDPGSTYAAFALHGSGLTALQYRHLRGANTEDIELNVEAPQILSIEKRGDIFTAYVSLRGEPPRPVGASTRLHLRGPFYLGLGALSHDTDTTDAVEFSRVEIHRPNTAKMVPTLYSTLQVIQTEDQFRRATAIRNVPALMRSANWTAGSKTLYVEKEGTLERYAYFDPPVAVEPQLVALGKLGDCTGNFGVSPDTRWIAVSCTENVRGEHQVYILPAEGGDAPRQLTRGQSSFFHAWSPDGLSIAFTRGSASKADIYVVPAAGGTEVRLTADAINDGPDFSTDGKYIYFDSSRSGSTQIWRMHPDGSGAEQITDDENENSSPHASPDGKSLAFLSRPSDMGTAIGDAAIKIMSLDDGLIRNLVAFQGNRDSFAMPSWGDRNHLAFVSYQRLP